RVRLHPAEFYVGVRAGSYFAAVGESVPAEVVAVRPDGQQAAGVDVHVTVSRRVWRSVREETAGGGVTWTSQKVDEEVSKETVATLAGAPAQTKIRLDAPGLYIVEARAKDAAGKEVVASDRLWVWGGGDAAWARSDDER